MATDNKKVELTKSIIEGVVDVVAIAGLITLIAGASVGARLGGKSGGEGGGGGNGGTPASVLLLIFTPLLQAIARMSRSARVMFALGSLALSVAACGAASTQTGATIHRTLWDLLRGTCSVVVNTPEPPAGGEEDGGVP